MKKETQKKQIKLDAQDLLQDFEIKKLKGGSLTAIDPCACKSGCRSACINGGQV